MSKKPRLREPFDKRHCKRARALYKSASQHLFHIHWSRSSQLTWETFLLLTCQIWGLLVNTLAADEKYPVLAKDNLTIPIQMQLSHKRETFSQFFAEFLESIKNLRFPKTRSDKSLKSLVSDDPSTNSMVNVPKHCWNLHYSIFIRFIDHCQFNWVGKSLSFWYTKSWDCLLTHCLPMENIHFLRDTI